MNILYTCNEFPPVPHGGLGTFVKEVSAELVKKGHRVIVYGVYKDVKQRVVEDVDGVTVIKDPATAGTSLLKRIQIISAYCKAIDALIKEHAIDIVEAHDTGGYFLFLKHKPLFVRLHNTERYFKKRSKGIVLLEKLSFRKKDLHIVAVSNYILQEFNKFSGTHPSATRDVISNGIQILPPQSETNGKDIVFAGTLKPVKGLKTLLEAYATSGLHEQGYKLCLYGNDTKLNGKSYFQHLLDENKDAKSLYESGNIVYDGPIAKSELLKKFAESYMCIFPSQLESFGLVVIEAMSQGAKVIYSNQGAATEIVDDGKDGFLFEKNNADDLRAKMISIGKLDEDALNTLKKNAIEKSKKFSLEVCVNKTLELYNKYLNK